MISIPLRDILGGKLAVTQKLYPFCYDKGFYVHGEVYMGLQHS